MEGPLTRRNATAPEFHLAKIETWLAPKLAPAARPKATEAALCHMAMTPDGDTVNDIIDRIKLDKESKPAEIAEKLLDTARASVESHTRPQRYAVVLYENAEMPIGRREFLLMPPPTNGQFMGETEPANMLGMLGQQMRHTEGSHRTAMLMQQTTLTMFETEIERLRKENAELRAAHFSMIQAREDLLDRSAERTMRIRQEQAEYDQGQRWVRRAEGLVGAVAEKVLGLPEGMATGGTHPDPSSPPTPMKAWLEKLPQEKKGKIMGFLEQELSDDEARGFVGALEAMKE